MEFDYISIFSVFWIERWVYVFKNIVFVVENNLFKLILRGVIKLYIDMFNNKIVRLWRN